RHPLFAWSMIIHDATASARSASLKAALQFGAVDIAPNEYDPALARGALLPRADGAAVREHVDSLKRKALVLAAEVQNAFGTQQILSLLLQDAVDPSTEPLHVERRIRGQTERDDRIIVVVIVLAGQ